MAIRRACSYEATIKTPVAPSEYSAVLVTFSQDGNNLINKEIGDAGLTLDTDSVVVQLSQEETLLFQRLQTVACRSMGACHENERHFYCLG